MVKSGEVYRSSPDDVVNGWCTTDNRPRLICNPSKEMAGILNGLNYYFIKLLSNCYEPFVSGLNMQ